MTCLPLQLFLTSCRLQTEIKTCLCLRRQLCAGCAWLWSEWSGSKQVCIFKFVVRQSRVQSRQTTQEILLNYYYNFVMNSSLERERGLNTNRISDILLVGLKPSADQISARSVQKQLATVPSTPLIFSSGEIFSRQSKTIAQKNQKYLSISTSQYTMYM